MKNIVRNKKTKYVLGAIFVLLFLLGIPYLISYFSSMTYDSPFAIQFTSGEVLSYYGGVLAFIGTSFLAFQGLKQANKLHKENNLSDSLKSYVLLELRGTQIVAFDNFAILGNSKIEGVDEEHNKAKDNIVHIKPDRHVKTVTTRNDSKKYSIDEKSNIWQKDAVQFFFLVENSSDNKIVNYMLKHVSGMKANTNRIDTPLHVGEYWDKSAFDLINALEEPTKYLQPNNYAVVRLCYEPNKIRRKLSVYKIVLQNQFGYKYHQTISISSELDKFEFDFKCIIEPGE